MVFYERHCVLSHERQCVPLLGARFVLVKWPPSRSVGRQRSLAAGSAAGEGEVLQRVAPREKMRVTEIPRAMSATPLKHSLKTPWCSLPSPRPRPYRPHALRGALRLAAQPAGEERAALKLLADGRLTLEAAPPIGQEPLFHRTLETEERKLAPICFFPCSLRHRGWYGYVILHHCGAIITRSPAHPETRSLSRHAKVRALIKYF